jgi:hypothetical protein
MQQPLPSASWLSSLLLRWWVLSLLFHPSSRVLGMMFQRPHHCAAWAVVGFILLRIVVVTTDATNVLHDNEDSIGSLDFGPCRITALLPFR